MLHLPLPLNKYVQVQLFRKEYKFNCNFRIHNITVHDGRATQCTNIPSYSLLTGTDLTCVFEEESSCNDEGEIVTPEIVFSSCATMRRRVKMSISSIPTSETSQIQYFTLSQSFGFLYNNWARDVSLSMYVIVIWVFRGCTKNYELVVWRDKAGQTTHNEKFVYTFSTCKSLQNYCDNYKLIS